MPCFFSLLCAFILEKMSTKTKINYHVNKLYFHDFKSQLTLHGAPIKQLVFGKDVNTVHNKISERHSCTMKFKDLRTVPKAGQYVHQISLLQYKTLYITNIKLEVIFGGFEPIQLLHIFQK